MPVAAGLGPPPEHALISLLALNGLRVSEATGAGIEHLGLERGRRQVAPHRMAAPPGGYGSQAELAHRPIPAAEAEAARRSLTATSR